MRSCLPEPLCRLAGARSCPYGVLGPVSVVTAIWAGLLPAPAAAADPSSIPSVNGLTGPILEYSLDIDSSGKIYVAYEMDGFFGGEIDVLRSTDSGLTWEDWGLFRSFDPDEDYRDPSLHVAEGDVDRLFVAYAIRYAEDPPGPPTEGGAIEVAYQDLSDAIPSWTQVTVTSTDAYGPSEPSITSDAAFHTDYVVHLGFNQDVKFFKYLGYSGSTDYGATWSNPGGQEVSAFNLDVDLAVGPGDKLHAVLGFGRLGYTQAEGRVPSLLEWSNVTLVSDPLGTDCACYSAHIAADPSSGEVAVAFTDEGSRMLVIASPDSGSTWTPYADATELSLVYGDLDHGPQGYGVAGYGGASEAFVGANVSYPLGSWNFVSAGTIFLSPTMPLFAPGAQIAWDPTHSQWGMVALGNSGAVQDSLFFYGEWFDTTTGVPGTSMFERMLSISPNPSTSWATIRWGDVLGREILRVRAVDARGTLIREWDAPDKAREIEWDLTDRAGRPLPAGVYFVDLQDEAGAFGRSKLVVLR